MKLLYKKNYVQRDLYVIKYKGKYLMVYRSSGLNPGRAGRILPFNMLAAPLRATIGSPVPGYIYKEFFFDNAFCKHYKTPENFGKGISECLIELEDFLTNHPTELVLYDHLETSKDFLPVAKEINIELLKAIKDLEPFDWKDLTT